MSPNGEPKGFEPDIFSLPVTQFDGDSATVSRDDGNIAGDALCIARPPSTRLCSVLFALCLNTAAHVLRDYGVLPHVIGRPEGVAAHSCISQLGGYTVTRGLYEDSLGV